MIAYLKGKIIYKEDYLIIESSGVGYKVSVPVKILAKKKVNDEIAVYTHQHIREDALDLYGFSNMAELKFFEDLISISGVGPKSGLAVIAKFEINDVKKSIASEDISLLTKVPGIGKKTAERMILELKNKMDVIDGMGNYKQMNQVDDETVDALISLGYHKSQAVQVLSKLDKGLSLEEKVKQALKHI